MGPFKCPDCGVWWAGVEHRCQPLVTGTGTIKYVPFTTGTVDTTAQTYPFCACPATGLLATCPAHPGISTYIWPVTE